MIMKRGLSLLDGWHTAYGKAAGQHAALPEHSMRSGPCSSMEACTCCSRQDPLTATDSVMTVLQHLGSEHASNLQAIADQGQGSRQPHATWRNHDTNRQAAWYVVPVPQARTIPISRGGGCDGGQVGVGLVGRGSDTSGQVALIWLRGWGAAQRGVLGGWGCLMHLLHEVMYAADGPLHITLSCDGLV